MGGSATWEIYNKLRQFRSEQRGGGYHRPPVRSGETTEAPWICVGCGATASHWSPCWDCDEAPLVPAALAKPSLVRAPSFWERLLFRPARSTQVRGRVTHGQPLVEASPGALACVGAVASATRGFDVEGGAGAVRVEGGATLVSAAKAPVILRKGDRVELRRQTEPVLEAEGYREHRSVWTGTARRPLILRVLP